MTSLKVQTGLERFFTENLHQNYRDARVGVLAHEPSVDGRFRHLLERMQKETALDIRVIFAPEHGLFGTEQDQIPMEQRAKWGGAELVTLYGERFDSLWPSVEDMKKIDVLIADIQDIGTRYYTYFNSLAFTMEIAAKAGVKVVVLDRPNPIGGQATEGGLLDESMRSFVGYYTLPVRYAMTSGELAKLVNEEEGIDAELEVIQMKGWLRSMHFPQTGLGFVMPSPNMPSYETTLVYPGGCLLEGTNLSEGRGTTRPFELFGAPYLDADRLICELEEFALQGVAFRKTAFIPTFHKWAGEVCNGVQVHVTNPTTFRSWQMYALAIGLIRKNHPDAFRWREETYEYVNDRLAIDLLFGHRAIREALETSPTPEALLPFEKQADARFLPLREKYLLYPNE